MEEVTDLSLSSYLYPRISVVRICIIRELPPWATLKTFEVAPPSESDTKIILCQPQPIKYIKQMNVVICSKNSYFSFKLGLNKHTHTHTHTHTHAHTYTHKTDDQCES